MHSKQLIDRNGVAHQAQQQEHGERWSRTTASTSPKTKREACCAKLQSSMDSDDMDRIPVTDKLNIKINNNQDIHKYDVDSNRTSPQKQLRTEEEETSVTVRISNKGSSATPAQTNTV